MDVLSDAEIDNTVSKSKLTSKYSQVIDNQNAYEILPAKLQTTAEKPPEVAATKTTARPEESTFEKVANSSITKSIIHTAGNTIVRSLLGFVRFGRKKYQFSKKKGN